MIIPGVVASSSRPAPTVTTGAGTNTTAAPTVTTSAATNFDNTSGVMNGTTSTGVLSYKWGTTSNPTTVSSSSTLTGLTTNTLYYFRAVGTNNNATATLAGTITTPFKTNVYFEYSGASTGPFTEVYSTQVSGASNQSCTVSLSGLTPSTTYYFRIKAQQVNDSRVYYGNLSSFTATSASAQGAVLSFKTYRERIVTATTVGSFTWTNPVKTSGTSGKAITSIHRLLIIGGGGQGGVYSGGGSGQGRYLATKSIGTTSGSDISLSVGGSNQISSCAGESAAAGQQGDITFVSPNVGGTSGNGFAGGQGWSDFFGGSGNYGGGGGGAGAAGNNYTGYPSTPSAPGAGGAGAVLDGYAYGGGGGAFTDAVGPNQWAAGGSNGGGSHSAGAANTGGGGAGGGDYSGGPLYAGGSGYVRFRYYGPDGTRTLTGMTDVVV